MCFSPKRKHFGKFIAQNATDEYHLSNETHNTQTNMCHFCLFVCCRLQDTKEDILEKDCNQTTLALIDLLIQTIINYFVLYLCWFSVKAVKYVNPEYLSVSQHMVQSG